MLKAVDLFAGFGGFSLAAEQAGMEVVYAANHWPLAVKAHAANHPKARHVCQDLQQADWRDLPLYDVLVGGPSCQPHSSASQPGRRPYHDAMRANPWAIVSCVEVTRPKALVIENVPNFRRWPLYDLWKAALERLGYTISENVLNASLHGVPQRRERLFVTGTLNGKRVVVESGKHETPFGPCIDWNEGEWRPVRTATPLVQKRVARSRARHGARFLTQHTSDHFGVPLNEPIRTITTKDQWAIVDGDRYRPLTIRENARGMSFPDDYRWPEGCTRRDQITGLGNAVPPKLAKDVIEATASVAFEQAQAA